MLIHGWQKLSGFSEMAETFPDPLGMGSRMSLISAIGTELGCSLLLIAGVATRLVALPLAFTMIVALFVVHGNDPWKVKFSLDQFFFGKDKSFTVGGNT